jgi:uncharacterized membrane protein
MRRESGERAIIIVYADPRQRGTAFGWYQLMVGIAAIPAALFFGSIRQFQRRGGSVSLRGSIGSLSGAAVADLGIVREKILIQEKYQCRIDGFVPPNHL